VRIGEFGFPYASRRRPARPYAAAGRRAACLRIHRQQRSDRDTDGDGYAYDAVHEFHGWRCVRLAERRFLVAGIGPAMSWDGCNGAREVRTGVLAQADRGRRYGNVSEVLLGAVARTRPDRSD